MEDLIGIQIRGRYDGVSHREDKEGNRLSRISYLPLQDDELCKYGKIYKVEAIGDYDFNILSERDDK